MNVHHEQASSLMDRFAIATGLTDGLTGRRYLWTDAFAVCNLLELWRASADETFRQAALLLVDQVHHVLGRHRPDDHRQGWISGLDEREGSLHPTAGGLRIGKPKLERPPDEPLDPRKEWDRDGQYYHYLTKWMHALQRVFEETGDPSYHRWAVELARAAHSAFIEVDDHGRPTGMVWKKSIDLTRTLVPSMGQHDPLDGLVTFITLEAGGKNEDRESESDLGGGSERELGDEIDDLARICTGLGWTTTDPLGAGGLLTDLYRLVRLTPERDGRLEPLLESVLKAALASVDHCAGSGMFTRPADRRLAFREIGLAVGLAAVERLSRLLRNRDRGAAWVRGVERLRRHLPLRERINSFWLDPANRQVPIWTEHEDINGVMLATSLAPAGFLGRPAHVEQASAR